MTVVVVGSIAFDSVKTPFGQREHMLGGSAVHFSLAASFFSEVRIVGPVGDDFGADQYAVLQERGVDTDDIEHVRGGKTFFWRGHYDYDLNKANTDEIQLNVFGDFQPKLSEASKKAETLFLAAIQPGLQLRVHEQSDQARVVALDSRDLWIETTRDDLLKAIEAVDIVFMNDAELRMLTEQPNLVRGARLVREMGPQIVVAKQGEHGAALFTEGGFFALPGYPLEDVLDPTGAGDSFAGGFLGYLDAHPHEERSDDLVRRAMTYGSVMASFNVEEFGTERVQRLTLEEINERFAEFKRITHFEAVPLDSRVAPRLG
jgi:sugar/nucleoside kinase (ribokinase family)